MRGKLRQNFMNTFDALNSTYSIGYDELLGMDVVDFFLLLERYNARAKAKK